jgi:hypothetical protein
VLEVVFSLRLLLSVSPMVFFRRLNLGSFVLSIGERPNVLVNLVLLKNDVVSYDN